MLKVIRISNGRVAEPDRSMRTTKKPELGGPDPREMDPRGSQSTSLHR
jgi:hypothetical protein